ncbi:MAG: acetylxylan esterase, partial [Armatimonadota bacterium]|nr:acetylxylan esterase [Armatimonadota bacterium]
MQCKHVSISAIVAIIVLTLMEAAAAMNVNLALPYDDTCSGPQTPYLAFYSPQSRDLLFRPAVLPSKTAPIEIFCQAGLRSVGMTWTLHRNMVDKPFRQGQAEALPADLFRIPISPNGLPPGFYDLRVVLDTGMAASATSGARPVAGVCVFGWRVPEMGIRETRPPDFKAFWDKARADLAKIPLDARAETPMETFNHDQINAYNLKSAALPADYDPTGHKTEEVESGKISFAGPDGGRVYAWLAKPKGPGPFPAMLVLPGAGFSARPRPLEHARHGYLAIDIQIHGQDVDLKDYPKLPGYYDHPQYEPAQSYYFYNVHLRVM